MSGVNHGHAIGQREETRIEGFWQIFAYPLVEERQSLPLFCRRPIPRPTALSSPLVSLSDQGFPLLLAYR